jgi:hypothetical protein
LRISPNATPGFAGVSSRERCNASYCARSPVSKTRFSSSKSKSARDEIATTSLSSSVNFGIAA